MKIPTRPSLAVLLAATGVALAGCPEKPPQPRTTRAATVAAAEPTPAALPGPPDFTYLVEQGGPVVANVTAVAELTVPPSLRNS
jgi:hypothetical protein